MEDPKAKLKTLIDEGRQIRSMYQTAKDEFERGAPMGELATEAGVDLFKDAFGIKKKYTRPFARQLRPTWERAPVHQKAEQDYGQWSGRVVEFLSGVSIVTSSLRPPGNTERLLRRWHTSQKGKRLETRLNHALQTLEGVELQPLIFNKDIPAFRRIKRKPKEVLIPAGRRIKAESELENLLSHKVQMYLKICDPYVSKETLKYIEILPQGVAVKILTSHIGSSGRFKKALNVVRRGRSVEVRRVTMSKGRTPLHDRYVLTKGRGWTVGTSLKDVGKKDTVISEIEDIGAFEHRFDSFWRPHDVIVAGEKCSVERV